MSDDVLASIADANAQQAEARLRRLVFLAATALGLLAALYYAWQDLTLSHYDARGHLMVARRVIDNLTPGWIQLGAVWLPLPHLLNMVPAQWDWSYQTGAVATLLSVLAQSMGLAALAGFLLRRTHSQIVATVVPLLILLNPDVLYLQSTPMTEPLLFGLSLLALDTISRWLDRGDDETQWKPGLVLAGLVLTRYEGWCIAGAMLALVALTSPRRALSLARYPLAAIVGFLFLSKGATGVWFVTSGFFEANNPALGHPLLAIGQVIGGASRLGGAWLLVVGALGLLACLASALVSSSGAIGDRRVTLTQSLLPIALLAAAALPVYAFSNGHPFRIRYMVAVVVSAGVLSAFALVRLPLRLRTPAAMVCLALSLWVTPPLDPNAPMVREAQWDRPHSEARHAVTETLTRIWDHTPIMASMGSLGHYMQQMSKEGFALRDFLHEGNGDLWWKSAFRTPERYVHWILIEESADGGDMLAQRAREDPAFLAGFDRVAEGGGVALYQRRPLTPGPPNSSRD